MTLRSLPLGIRLAKGSRRDWQCFAPHHYVKSPLGPLAGVWLLLEGQTTGPERPVAFVAYAYPGLGCTGRRRVFGRSHCRGALAERLPRLNASLRVLHRLVVLPGWRGRGLGPSLVAATLPLLDVPWVECLAMAPGPLVRAGMSDTGPLDPSTRRVDRPHYLIWDHPALYSLRSPTVSADHGMVW